MYIFTPTQNQILSFLADGQFHSGSTLATSLKISRTAIWKQIQTLTDLDIEIIALNGKGYKLPRPLELLATELIQTQLTPMTQSLMQRLEIFAQINSTNSYLMQQAQINRLSGWVCFAESQTAGKGRRGRQWISPFGSNIYLSILWRFQSDPASISGLSLAIGVAVIRFFQTMGITEVGLKWPNDIYWREKKLGGILIEVAGEAGGECYAVIGLGLNLYLPADIANAIQQPWTDLEQIMQTQAYSKNTIAAHLLNQLLPVIANFENNTLPIYLNEWRNYDVMCGKKATLYIGQQTLEGTVMGINEQGLLLFKNSQGEIKAFASGEISFSKTLR